MTKVNSIVNEPFSLDVAIDIMQTFSKFRNMETFAVGGFTFVGGGILDDAISMQVLKKCRSY